MNLPWGEEIQDNLKVFTSNYHELPWGEEIQDNFKVITRNYHEYLRLPLFGMGST
jgi:hypothetical protein